MTENTKKTVASNDYYDAKIENGALQMEPHCACGNPLNDDYFCEKCNRQCRCRHIICDNEETLAQVKQYIRKSPQFSEFTAFLAGSNEK